MKGYYLEFSFIIKIFNDWIKKMIDDNEIDKMSMKWIRDRFC